MNRIRTAVDRRPLTAFVITAYALSWWSIPFAGGGILPYGPFIAAVLILALTHGRPGIRALLRRMASFQGGWYWLLIAPGLVVAYLLFALALNLMLGATITDTSHLSSLAPSLLGLILLGGMWEEPGWTGYALPLLRDRYANRPYSLLRTSLHLGAIRAVWHLPLMISGAIPWYDVLFFSIGFQFLISWLFSRTGGSVLIAMLFHLTSNVVGGEILLPLFTGSDHDRYYQLFIGLAWLLAILLAGLNRWRMDRPEGAL